MSVYSFIIKRLIEHELHIDFNTNPHTRDAFSKILTIAPEIQNWETLCSKIRCFGVNEAIVYILMLFYSNKMEVHFGENAKNTESDTPLYLRQIHYKFSVIHSIYSNEFFTDALREIIVSMFQQTQRIYNAFSRFAQIYRYKRTPVQVSADLYMNELSPIKRTTFRLLDNGKLYYFGLNDLTNLITGSLTYSYMVFAEPKVCKNPYNNIPFSKSTLYNIYFQMKTVFCVVPRLIQLFFESDFNVFLFKKRNEPALREAIIREYVEKTDPLRLRSDILKMIRLYDLRQQLSIHPLFPSKTLVQCVKPIYILYLCYQHSPDEQTRDYYQHEIHHRMARLIRDNPNFGRITFNARYPSVSANHFTPSTEPVTFPTEPTPTHNVNLSDSAFTPFSMTERYRIIGNLQQRSRTPLYNQYHDEIVRTRENRALDEFMQNHRYDDAAYNRYVMSGSILAQRAATPESSGSESDTTETSPNDSSHNDDTPVSEPEFEPVFDLDRPAQSNLTPAMGGDSRLDDTDNIDHTHDHSNDTDDDDELPLPNRPMMDDEHDHEHSNDADTEPDNDPYDDGYDSY
jgi:hypothetical protein